MRGQSLGRNHQHRKDSLYFKELVLASQRLHIAAKIQDLSDDTSSLLLGRALV